MKLKNYIKLFVSAVILSTAVGSVSAVNPASLFISAPQSRFPFLSKMKRMDMVDYFNSGVSRASENLLGGKSRILQLTPDQITIEMVEGGVSTTSLSIVPFGKNDSLIVVVSNVATPAPDGMVSFYSTDWKETDSKRLFAEPTFDDWLVKGLSNNERATVRNAVPFIMAEYSFDPESGILVLKPTVEQYLPKDDFALAKGKIVGELRYKWTGKKMEKLK